jgi:hypothetical protein
MKIYLLIINLIILCIQDLKSQIVLDSNNRGFEGIILGETTKNEIIAKFGKNFKQSIGYVQTIISCRFGDTRPPEFSFHPRYKIMHFKKKGVQFKFNLTFDTLQCIVFTKKSRAKTFDNIQICKTLISEVFANKSNLERKYFDCGKYCYEYEGKKFKILFLGISFNTFTRQHFATKTGRQKIMNSKVQQIEIYLY